MDINSELKGAQLEIKDGDYAHNVNEKGRIWFNRVADKIKASFNGAIELLATESYVDDEINASEDLLKSTGLITVEQGSKPISPYAGERKLYAMSDGIYELDSNGVDEKLERYSDAKIREVDHVFINRDDGNGDGNDTLTIHTVPAGYKWSFVGHAWCSLNTGGVTHKEITFDGYRYSRSTHLGSNGEVVNIYGSGGSGAVQITYSPENHSYTYSGVRGLLTIYKEQ